MLFRGRKSGQRMFFPRNRCEFEISPKDGKLPHDSVICYASFSPDALASVAAEEVDQLRMAFHITPNELVNNT